MKSCFKCKLFIAISFFLISNTKIFKFDKFHEILKSNVDLIVLGISSKGIEWVSDQLSKFFKGKKIPKILMLTKGLSIYNNKYELLVEKLERLLKNKGFSQLNIPAVGGPCLASGLANRVHSSVVIANKDIQTAKKTLQSLLDEKKLTKEELSLVYLGLSEVYINEKNYKQAVTYLEKAHKTNQLKELNLILKKKN